METSYQESLGDFSILPWELRDEIWFFALADTAITYQGVPGTEPLALTRCSKAIRKEVITTIKLQRSVTVNAPAALTRLLERSEDQKTTSLPNGDSKTVADWSPLPKRIRMYFFRLSRADPRLQTESREAIFHEGHNAELQAWQDALQRLPIGHLTALTLDGSLFLNGYPVLPTCLVAFVKRLAMRIRMVSKGACACLLVAHPSATAALRIHVAGLVKEWTPVYDGCSVTERLEQLLEASERAKGCRRHTNNKKRKRLRPLPVFDESYEPEYSLQQASFVDPSRDQEWMRSTGGLEWWTYGEDRWTDVTNAEWKTPGGPLPTQGLEGAWSGVLLSNLSLYHRLLRFQCLEIGRCASSIRSSGSHWRSQKRYPFVSLCPSPKTHF
jgi:hypothetical protein